MTVKQLKELLDKFPEDATVYIPSEMYACIPHVLGRADAVTDYMPPETGIEGPAVMIY